MIVRESPSRRNVTSNPPSWPPKSPHEAVLSSPSARKKYEHRRTRSSVSPSPSKRPLPASRNQSFTSDAVDDDEDDDEEMLQLKLQAIEARLKLKQLQKARRAAEGPDPDANSTASSSRPSTASGTRRVDLPRPEPDVQILASPTRARRTLDEQRSPARVLLGIDKGLRAQDVSLKRAGSFGAGSQHSAGGRLARSNTTGTLGTPKIKSFSERIAESRSKEKQREENEAKHEQRKSRGFGLNNIEGLRDRPSSQTGSFNEDTRSSQEIRGSQDMPPPTLRPSSRPQSLLFSDRSRPPTPRRGSDTPSRPTSSSSRPSSKGSFTKFDTSATASTPSKAFGTSATATKYAEIARRDESADAPSFESLSGLHLKSREMQHNVVTRTLEGKTVLTIPQLLKTVKAPLYEPPDWENDYVVMGVICSKSSPLNAKNTARDQTAGSQERDPDQHGKFMVVRLTDMKWEIDLYLFDTGFSHFWKLSVGTLVAILNPDIMPPRNRDTGKFSLKLTSSDDTVLEIGMARDLDFCHAIRKDGKECGQWIDSRKTEYCEFHVQLQVDKSRKGRMEINTMVGMGKGPSGGGKYGMFAGRGGPKGDELRREGKFHDRGLHETVYIAPRPGGSAKLIDRDEQAWERGASRDERFRKQLAEKEKERELAKRLGKMGEGSTGGDYMKMKGVVPGSLPIRGSTPSQGPSSSAPERSLVNDFRGLLNRKADDVSLAPIKRKRTTSVKSGQSSEPMGWGGAFRRGLLPSPKKERPDSALRGVRGVSPAKKKARLLLPEKGIREPGRDSLGVMDVGLLAAMDDDDDDDLEVI
jgi:minichromosome maintenance protein 10